LLRAAVPPFFTYKTLQPAICYSAARSCGRS